MGLLCTTIASHVIFMLSVDMWSQVQIWLCDGYILMEWKMSGSFAQSKMLIKLFLKIILTNKLDSNWIYYLITWSFQVETLTKVLWACKLWEETIPAILLFNHLVYQ